MKKNESRKPRSRMAILVTVLLLLVGVGAIGASLWMQESEIALGVEEYEALAQQFRCDEQSPDTAEVPDNLPDQQTEVIPAEQDDTEQPPVVVIPEEIPAEQPAVTVVPPMTVQPVEQSPAHQFDPTPEGSGAASAGLTGADLAACKATNSDFVAWLQIPGTDIDYPVVLTNDVDYYLDHTFAGSESSIGCLFSLGRTDYSAPSSNIAIYGHHMRRSRSTTMFQPLHNYKSASFRAANDTILLDTIYGSRSYEVFAVINKRESDWDVSVADFAADTEYQTFLDRAQSWSLYDTGVTVTPDDHIITLITCDRDYNAEDGQLVVMAVER